MFSRQTKMALFFLVLLILILYLAHYWPGFENLNNEEKVKKEGGFLKETVFSFIGKRLTLIPGEFKKEVEEMKLDLIRLNKEFWQGIWQKTEKTFQNIWHLVFESWKSFWQMIWPKIRSTLPQ